MRLADIRTDGKKYREQVLKLYEAAFPEEEKKPFSMMEMWTEQGKLEILVVLEGEEFLGLAINMLEDNVALLDYFAIAPEKRNGGVGGQAVRLLQERFAGKKYIFEIEMQDEKADNAADRKRRKAFYLRNGLKETGLFVHAYKTDFEIITPDGELTYKEYVDMLQKNLGDEMFRVVDPRLIKENAEDRTILREENE